MIIPNLFPSVGMQGIQGVGVDICSVDRILQTYERQGHRFVKRILGEQEQVIWQERQAAHTERGLLFLATRFCVKEALGKALGTGIAPPMTWQMAQILPTSQGKPEFEAQGTLKKYLEMNHLKIKLSMSDEKQFVIAFVIVHT